MRNDLARGFFAIGADGISKAMNLGNLIRSANAFGTGVGSGDLRMLKPWVRKITSTKLSMNLSGLETRARALACALDCGSRL